MVDQLLDRTALERDGVEPGRGGDEHTVVIGAGRLQPGIVSRDFGRRPVGCPHRAVGIEEDQPVTDRRDDRGVLDVARQRGRQIGDDRWCRVRNGVVGRQGGGRRRRTACS